MALLVEGDGLTWHLVTDRWSLAALMITWRIAVVTTFGAVLTACRTAYHPSPDTTRDAPVSCVVQ